MPLIKIMVCDASSQPLAGLDVVLSKCGALKSNAQGLVQFLAGEPVASELTIGGVVVWAGSLAELTRNEVFMQSASGFTRMPAA